KYHLISEKMNEEKYDEVLENEEILKHFNFREAELLEKHPYAIETITGMFPGSNYSLISEKITLEFTNDLKEKITERNLKNASKEIKISYLGLLWNRIKYQINNKIKNDFSNFCSNTCDFLNISESEFLEYTKTGINQPLPSASDIKDYLNTGNTKRKSDISKMKNTGSVVINDYNTLKKLLEVSSEKVKENEELINLYNNRIPPLEEDIKELNTTLSDRGSEHFEIFGTHETLWKDIDKQVKLEGTKKVIELYEKQINQLNRIIRNLEPYIKGWELGVDKIKSYLEELNLDPKSLERKNSCWVSASTFPDDKYWSKKQYDMVYELCKNVSLTHNPSEKTWKNIIDALCEI
ncbi:MAG: hypothetical protein DRP06_02655, partial [Candidatus Aenigmatarchaeota archaeon]